MHPSTKLRTGSGSQMLNSESTSSNGFPSSREWHILQIWLLLRVRPKTYYTKYVALVISNVESPSTGSGTGLPGQW